jgi:hypothetical protein
MATMFPAASRVYWSTFDAACALENPNAAAKQPNASALAKLRTIRADRLARRAPIDDESVALARRGYPDEGYPTHPPQLFVVTSCLASVRSFSDEPMRSACEGSSGVREN